MAPCLLPNNIVQVNIVIDRFIHLLIYQQIFFSTSCIPASTETTKITAVSKRNENPCPRGVYIPVKGDEQYTNGKSKSNTCCGENKAGKVVLGWGCNFKWGGQK